MDREDGLGDRVRRAPAPTDSAAGTRRPGRRASSPPRAAAPAPGRARRPRRPARPSSPTARIPRPASRPASSSPDATPRIAWMASPGHLNRFTGDITPTIMAAHGALGARAGRARRLLPPAAQAGRPPHASPTTCGGAGTRGPGSCSRASTPAAGRATATRSPSCPGPVDWSQLLDDTGVHGRLPRHPRPSSSRYMANGADHWFQRRHAQELEGPIAYFCAEYGLHESLGIYSGGLGVLAGDHMKAASDMALPLDRRRALCTATATSARRSTPTGTRSTPTPTTSSSRLPIRRALRRARGAAHGQRRAARPRLFARRLGGAGRPRAAAAARHRHPRQRRLRPADHAHPVRPRPRDAAAPGDRAGRRRRARAARARASTPAAWHLNEGHSAFLLVERARELVAAGASPRRGVLGGPPQQRVHDPHAGLGRQRALRRATSSGASPARCSMATGGRRPAASRSSGCSSLGLGVENDPSQFDMTAFSLRDDARRQRRLAAPRPDRQRHLAGHQPGRDPGHHQRRPHADLGRPADARHARAVDPRRPGHDGRPARHAAVLGAHRASARRTSCGRRTSARSWSSRSSPAAGCATSSPATARPRRRSRSSRTSSTRRS